MSFYVIVTLLIVLTSSCSAQPPAISISFATSSSFRISLSSEPSPESYEVHYEAQHNSSESGVVYSNSTDVILFRLMSNTNYDVKARAISVGNVTGAFSTITRTRTAPSGSLILQVITTPTFITVFLEETPGSTSWQIEYNNTITGVSNTVDVPAGVPSNTYYVAILTSLSPNTRYTLRARVSQINSDTNYTEAQSPYGNKRNVTTDKVSAFGRVVLVSRSYSAGDNNNNALKNEIAIELQAAYQDLSSDVFSVSVTELENDGSGKILCHHEIELNNRTEPPANIIASLELRNSSLYNNSAVRYGVGSNRSYAFSKNNGSFSLHFADDTACIASTDQRKWTVISKVQNDSDSNSFPLSTGDNNAASVNKVDFTDSAITTSRISPEIIFNLTQNAIYGIKQEYLIKTCPTDDKSTKYYNRIYNAADPLTTKDSDKFTIIRSTGITSISNDSFTYETTSNGTGVTLIIPSNLISRATMYTFNVAGINKTSLNEDDLDGSTYYRVALTGLPKNSKSMITVQANVRQSDNQLSMASATFSVITETNECVVSEPCHSNATCTNNVGSFSCTCKPGFSGNGLSCADINECTSSTNPHNCHSNATCTNNEGSYTCSCNSGYTGNGTNCADINECTSSTNPHNCHSNATCTNNEGSYTCSCNSGYTGNGTNCTDINECTSSTNPHNCHSNANCTNNEGSYTCSCNSGYTGNGTNCTDINECTSSTNPHNCHSNANCTNNVGSFSCTCKPGFSGDGLSCADIDECENRTLNDCATKNANCSNTHGSFTCECNSTYALNGSACVGIPPLEATFSNINQTFFTLTWNGIDLVTYEVSVVGVTNSPYRNLSATQLHVPGLQAGHNYSVRISVEGKDVSLQIYQVTLPGEVGGLTLNIGNDSVSIIWDETQGASTYQVTVEAAMMSRRKRREAMQPITRNVTGNNVTIEGLEPGSDYMVTVRAVNDAGSGKSVVQSFTTKANTCTFANNCSAYAVCTIVTTGGYECTCNDGYTGNGTHCDDIDECLNSTSNTCHANANCTNIKGSYSCICNVGYTGNGTHCDDIDECNDGNYTCTSNSMCSNTEGNYTCMCDSGFVANGSLCVDIDECAADKHNCTDSSMCVNTEGGFMCSCVNTTDCGENGECRVSSVGPSTCVACSRRTDEQLCSTCSISSCTAILNGPSSFRFNCSCEVDRDNPCGGLSASVSCEIDFCDETDLCKNHKNTICTKDGNTHECECNEGFVFSLEYNSCEGIAPTSASLGWIAAAVLVPILLMVAIIIFIYCKLRRRDAYNVEKARRRAAYHPRSDRGHPNRAFDTDHLTAIGSDVSSEDVSDEIDLANQPPSTSSRDSQPNNTTTANSVSDGHDSHNGNHETPAGTGNMENGRHNANTTNGDALTRITTQV